MLHKAKQQSQGDIWSLQLKSKQAIRKTVHIGVFTRFDHYFKNSRLSKISIRKPALSNFNAFRRG
jgi:hypothetical protein